MSLYKSQDIYLYNSLTSQRELLKPLRDGYIGMYVCGPTVYNNVHLGNVRTFVSFDVIFRYLKHLGYKVRYVRNITDAGHLENDADSGEDRIAKKARLDQIEPMEVVQHYTVDFHNVLNRLNCLPPGIEPTATGHIVEQIELIKKIIQKGFAYETKGSVYFDVIKFDKEYRYGTLSRRNIEDLIHNTRDLNGQYDKKNPQDFALWKRAEPQHIMRWTSPWSEGFPGWHLECTSMSAKYLGEKFDIHGGGMDLKFPHHECEIAQSMSVSGKNPVSYWIHANMLTLEGQKMAKSKGNIILPADIFSGNNDILSKAFSPAVTRFFMLQAHYRSVLDFSNDALIAAEKGYLRLMNAIESIADISPSETSDFGDIDTVIDDCYKAMNQDFNTPILISHLFKLVKIIQLVVGGKVSISAYDIERIGKTLNMFTFDVLGLENDAKSAPSSEKLEDVIRLLIGLRKRLRDQKDFAASDKIRDDLLSIGIRLKDTEDGITYYTIDR